MLLRSVVDTLLRIGVFVDQSSQYVGYNTTEFPEQ